MFEYKVQSGPLKITIVAETAYDAALEAVRWWGRRLPNSPAKHRRALEEMIRVRGSDSKSRSEERFPTFNVLAESENEAPEMAWDRLIDLAVASSN